MPALFYTNLLRSCFHNQEEIILVRNYNLIVGISLGTKTFVTQGPDEWDVKLSKVWHAQLCLERNRSTSGHTAETEKRHDLYRFSLHMLLQYITYPGSNL